MSFAPVEPTCRASNLCVLPVRAKALAGRVSATGNRSLVRQLPTSATYCTTPRAATMPLARVAVSR